MVEVLNYPSIEKVLAKLEKQEPILLSDNNKPLGLNLDLEPQNQLNLLRRATWPVAALWL